MSQIRFELSIDYHVRPYVTDRPLPNEKSFNKGSMFVPQPFWLFALSKKEVIQLLLKDGGAMAGGEGGKVGGLWC